MTTGMNFWDNGVWSFVLTISILLAAMMAANGLRNLIPPLRRMMIPSSVLGGFLLLLVSFLLEKLLGYSLFEGSTLESLTYHGLGLGFAAMSLRNLEKRSGEHRTDTFDTGVTVVGSYLVQAVSGLVISLALYFVLDSFFASGLLLPMGYGQGPGQAYNWGHTYELSYGFENGTSFGLTVAAMGFVMASIGGVIYLYVLRRRGIVTGDGGSIVDKDLSAQDITGKDEIPLSESMDKFTVQLALAFMAYILAYLIMFGIDCIISTGVLGNFGYNTVRPLVWGFNFLFSTISGIIIKALFRALRKKGVIKREYTNNFMQDRIAGFMFDMMVVASIAAINLSAFTHPEFVVPLLLICVVGAVLTFLYVHYVSRKIFPNYRHEAFLSLYGMLTGTASTGVILLREIDPQFKTPAANNLVYQQVWAIVFGFPMLLMLGLAPKGLTQSFITLGVLIVLSVVMNLILFRRQIFKRKKK